MHLSFNNETQFAITMLLQVIEGKWAKGELMKGTERKQIQKDGDVVVKEEVYEGEFQDWKRHGYGKAKYVDGSVYEGFWRNGRRNGQGTYVDALTQEKYEGKWVGDARNGSGRSSCRGAKFEGNKRV